MILTDNVKKFGFWRSFVRDKGRLSIKYFDIFPFISTILRPSYIRIAFWALFWAQVQFSSPKELRDIANLAVHFSVFHSHRPSLLVQKCSENIRGECSWNFFMESFLNVLWSFVFIISSKNKKSWQIIWPLITLFLPITPNLCRPSLILYISYCFMLKNAEHVNLEVKQA